MSQKNQTQNDGSQHLGSSDELADKKPAIQHETTLHEISLRLLQAQENERTRLAYELHDEIGQDLTILKLNLQAALKLLEEDGVLLPDTDKRSKLLAQLSGAYGLSETLLNQIRDLSLNLRPTMLDNLGLAPTIRWYLGRAMQSTDLDIQFHVPANFGRLPTEVETTFFRIAQEAVTNVLRHAQARHLWVQLAQRGSMTELHITDDGLGFAYPISEQDPRANETLGLPGMAWRASIINAQFEIETAPGKGTRISLIAAGQP
ncbi:MAG: sensor histidine kinase [Chloroflexi bacterium]|nr:MAG: sensor histidine kinase [Chloroflexota bacterium]